MCSGRARPPTVGVAGLTHLGLVWAAVTAAKGLRVVAFDPHPHRVAAIAAGRLPVAEPGLDDLLREHHGRLEVTADAGALATCDVVLVAVDVPTDDRNESDLGGIAGLIEAIGPSLGGEATLVVLSQVPPGFTRATAPPGRRVYYQAETLVVGNAIDRASRPERFIVGGADPRAPLPAPYAELLASFGCPILPMRYESAELAKLAINCCLVASLTTANTLAEISERIGADWAEIAPALRLDGRIGPQAYLTPGLGLAGGNLERDLATVLRLAAQTASEASVVAAFLTNSAHRREWALRTLQAEVLAGTPGAVVGVLGLAYKAHTASTRNAPALALIEHLTPWRVRVYDPIVPATAVSHPALVGAASALDAARGADALVVMTPWPQFRELKAPDLAAAMRGRTVVDPYRVLDAGEVVTAGLDYFTLGAPPRGHA